MKVNPDYMKRLFFTSSPRKIVETMVNALRISRSLSSRSDGITFRSRFIGSIIHIMKCMK
jgi:hypothetical protein